MPSKSADKLKAVMKGLNTAQIRAVVRVLMAKDYVLVQGFPGAGKTSTLVTAVKALTVLGKTVLITAYTHSAVDNILIKLDNVSF